MSPESFKDTDDYTRLSRSKQMELMLDSHTITTLTTTANELQDALRAMGPFPSEAEIETLRQAVNNFGSVSSRLRQLGSSELTFWPSTRHFSPRKFEANH